jgi:TPR repeat protein
MAVLSRVYEEGWGVDRDPKLAREWLIKAAQAGDLPSAVKVAEIALGSSEAPGGFDARHWYGVAAEKGSEEAMVALGRLLLAGQAGPVDYANARRWFEEAAGKGNVEAMLSLAHIYREGLGTPRNPDLAQDWQAKAEKADSRLPYRRKTS